MAYPSVYDVTYSYTGFQQAQQGISAFPGTQLDADLAGLHDSVSSLALFQRTALRSDGLLTNGLVTFDSLSPSLQTAGITAASGWITGVNYAVGAAVVFSEALYRCVVAHLSGVFATDLAAGKWLFVTPIFPNLVERVFPTLADAVAAAILPGTRMIQTQGRNAPGDNGGARYIRTTPSTPAAWRFQSADGQWWATNNRRLTPEMLGAFSGFDCTAALNALGVLLNTVSGGGGYQVDFTPNADYLWPAAVGSLIELNGVNGVTFNFNGARISTNSPFSGPGGCVVFDIKHCSNLVFHNPSYACTNPAVTGGAIDPLKFGVFFYVNEATAPFSYNIEINNAVQSWGSAFFLCVGDQSGTVQDQAHNFRINNFDISHVFYGLAFSVSGDNVIANGKATDCGRIYFPANVRNHDVQLIKNGGGGGYVSVILKAYGLPGANQVKRCLSNIKVRFTDCGETVTTGVTVGLDMQQSVIEQVVSGAANSGTGLLRLTVPSTAGMLTGQYRYVDGLGGITGINGGIFIVTVVSPTQVDLQGSSFLFGGAYTSGGYIRAPATLRDIDVQIATTLGSNEPPAFLTFKENVDGAPDLTTSGYTVENVELSGSLKNYDYGVPALSLFRNGDSATGTWVGEKIRNISLRNLTIEGRNTSALIDATSITNLVLENIVSTPTTVVWAVAGPGANVRVNNVSATGITDARTVTPETAPATQFTKGINTSGRLAFAQPAFTDISGVATAAQLPGLTTAMFAANVVDTDATLAANSDTRLASQKAVKAYADALIAANDAMVFKGVIDCSANPNYPAADRGHTYKVSVAGKIGGASGTNVEVGDTLLCITDGTAAGTQAAVGAQWNVVQVNIDGAVVGPASVTDDLPAIFDGVTGKLLKSKTYAAFKALLVLVKGDVGLGSVDNTADSAKVVASAAILTTARTINGVSFNGSANITTLAEATHAATSKTTPVDADELPLVDSAAANVLKRLTWANLKATLNVLYQPLLASAPVLTVKKQVFIATGTYTPSTGMLYAVIEGVGSGGGGGGVVGDAAGVKIGAGGGAGNYSRKLVTAADIGASKAVTIGAAGTGATAGANNGGAGGDVSVGVLMVAKGGSGGGFSQSGVQQGTGGAGGVAGTGDLTVPGAAGGEGAYSAGGVVYFPAGQGASSVFGGGAPTPTRALGTAGGGAAATGYGGGGSGGNGGLTVANQAGGAGFAGVVFITEYCSQ